MSKYLVTGFVKTEYTVEAKDKDQAVERFYDKYEQQAVMAFASKIEPKYYLGATFTVDNHTLMLVSIDCATVRAKQENSFMCGFILISSTDNPGNVGMNYKTSKYDYKNEGFTLSEIQYMVGRGCVPITEGTY